MTLRTRNEITKRTII